MSERKSMKGVRIFAIILGLHLALVAFSGLRGFFVSLRDAEMTKRKIGAYPAIIEQYGSLFAANQGFGFFAPGVASESRVRVMGCKRGVTDWHPLDIGLRGESQHFLNSFVGIGLRTEGRRPVAESIAAYSMSKYGDVDSVIVQYQAELIPTLHEGRLPREWITLEAFFYYR